MVKRTIITPLTIINNTFFFFFFFLSHFYSPASGQAVVTGVVPSSLWFLVSILSRMGFSNLTARRFSWGVLVHSRSRAFRKSICAQEKVPTNLYEYALGGAQTHETDLLYDTRLEDNLIRHRGDRHLNNISHSGIDLRYCQDAASYRMYDMRNRNVSPSLSFKA